MLSDLVQVLGSETLSRAVPEGCSSWVSFLCTQQKTAAVWLCKKGAQWGLSAPKICTYLCEPGRVVSSSLCNSPMNSGLFMLCTPKWVALVSWRDFAAALNPHSTPTPLCTLIPDAQLSNGKAQALHCSVVRWPHLHLYSSPRLPPELDFLLLHRIFAIVCNRTFISSFSLVQSKLILLADFSTVSGGSYGTLSMLLALMMHNTNPSLEQECALMMD